MQKILSIKPKKSQECRNQSPKNLANIRRRLCGRSLYLQGRNANVVVKYFSNYNRKRKNTKFNGVFQRIFCAIMYTECVRMFVIII